MESETKQTQRIIPEEVLEAARARAKGKALVKRIRDLGLKVSPQVARLMEKP